MRFKKKKRCMCDLLRDRRALLAWTEKNLGHQLCWLWQEQDREGLKRKSAFVYEHPASYRQWLAESPCVGCPCEERCDRICSLRALWWDARMKQLRRNLGVEK